MRKNHKLFNLLSCFSAGELKNFALFISSPYFNRLKNVTALFVLIRKHHPAFSSDMLTNEKLFSKIFPGDKYDDSRIRALFSYLYSLAEKFLAAENYFAGNNVLIDIIKEKRNRSFTSYLKFSIDKTFSVVNKNSIKDHVYFEEMYLLQYEKNHLGSHFKPEREFPLEGEYLSASYIIKMLKLYSTIFNIKSSLNISVDEKLINTVESLAELPGFISIPALKMNYLLYRVTRYLDENAFSMFIRNIETEPYSFKTGDLYQAFVLLLNFCVIMIRSGKNKYIKIKFELYKKLIAGKLWLNEGELPYVIFNNIVSSAIENYEQAYALDFISKYSSGINANERHNVTHFCYAKTYYSLKNYNEALNHLAKTGGMEDIFYKFAIKDLSIKIFYETSQYESVASLIDSYRHLISKSRIISLAVKQSYRTYLNFLAELIKPIDFSDFDQIKHRAQSSPGFVNKEWILSMLKTIPKT